MQPYSKFIHLHWKKCIWSCCLWNGSHFASASMCWYCVSLLESLQLMAAPFSNGSFSPFGWTWINAMLFNKTSSRRLFQFKCIFNHTESVWKMITCSERMMHSRQNFVCMVVLYLGEKHLWYGIVIGRDHFVYAPSQRKMALHCSAISRWLDAYI